MRSRLTSSHFVGRVRELAELELAVREATAGRSTLVLLGGDSGVGKSRLVSELEQRLSAGLAPDADSTDGRSPVLFLRGDGVEQADGELPYAPLMSALRPLVRGHHPALAELTPGSRAQLATILPGLDDDGRARPERSDGSGQLRLFEAVLELMDLASESAPLVLALEDMHWADRSTRTFVAFLARSLRQERMLLLLTYRTDELHRRHPLRPLLSELERLEGARRIDLAPFDRDELSEALADILGAAPEGPLLERLFVRSEGNPLFTEELLAAGLDGRGAAPQSLRDAFIARIERLSPGAQCVADAVAVGRSLDEPTLVAATNLEPSAVQAGLREAMSEQVLVARDENRFAFRHALLREAVIDDLLPGERAQLHLALARYLEDRSEVGDERELERATRVAGHYASAGDQPAALRSTVRAAHAAECVLAYGEAADLYENAMELWPRVPDAETVAGLDHVELLARGAGAHRVAGDRDRAEGLVREALKELGPTRDPARYAALLGSQSRTIWSLNRGQEAVALVERALAILPPEDPYGVRPQLLAHLARTRFLRGRFREVVADGEIALQAAVAAGDRSAESQMLNTLGMAQAVLGDVDQGVARLRQAIEVARMIGDVDDLATAYSNLADMLSMVGRTQDALTTAREGMAATPRRLSRVYDWMKLTVSEAAYAAGDWETSAEYLIGGDSRLLGVARIFAHEREAELALGTGDEARAQAALDAAEPLVLASAEPQWIGMYGVLRGELCRRQRHLEGAQRAVQDALDRLEVCTDDVMRIARVSVVGARVEADRAQRAYDLREPGQRRDALARAKIHVDRLDAAAQEGGPVERAYLAEAKAELARARGRDAAGEWASTAAAWDAVQRPYPAAMARWRQAEALVGAGDRAAATMVAVEALQMAHRLGSHWLIAELTTLGERARLDLRSAGRGRDGETGAAPDPFGLTPRERQVLGLVAQGATNRQIGAALFMAEKTASVHVSRILAKLDVQGRTEAAAVAHRLHLA